MNTDIADLIAGALGVSRGTAYDLMREALAEQPAQQQEPVAWMWNDGTVTTDPDRADGTWTPLYTFPPIEATPLASQRSVKPWVGLTDDEIALICAECSLRTPCDIYYARAIEAAHGIKE